MQSVLFEISDLAASQADNVKLVALENANFDEIKASRQRLRELAALMVRYTLSMSSNDCGGNSDYSEFFTAVRRVFNIHELRAELSAELKDVLAVVESHYLEEERRERDQAEMERRKNREVQLNMRQQRDFHDQRLGLVLSILGTKEKYNIY